MCITSIRELYNYKTMMNYKQMLYCATLALLTACSTADKKNAGKLIDALDSEAWEKIRMDFGS